MVHLPQEMEESRSPVQGPGGDEPDDYDIQYLFDETEAEDEIPSTEEGRLEVLGFNPPLYVQRYEKVKACVNQDKWNKRLRSILDFGCAECKLMLRLKRLEFVRRIIGVDLDRHTLDYHRDDLEPLPAESLFPRQKSPLELILMNGSIAEKDPRFRDKVDVVTCIEVLEHLDPEVLDRVPETVFGFIRPKLAVFSTPNSEFNVLFPDFEGPFRHWDHRFEWTRCEFQNWTLEVVGRYPDYEVEMTGVGDPPPGKSDDIGFCSQIAVFTRKDFSLMAQNGELDEEEVDDEGSFDDDDGSFPYETVVRVDYPFKPDARSKEERLNDEVIYSTRMSAIYSREWSEGEDFAEIELGEVANTDTIVELGYEGDFGAIK